MALANRCEKHNTPPDVYRYVEKDTGEWVITLYCAQCDEAGIENSSPGGPNINEQVREWNEANPVREVARE